MLRAFLMAALLALVPQKLSAETFLCVADAMTGFHYNQNTQTWQVANFKIDQKKYVLKNLFKDKWTWNTLGEQDYSPCDRFENETISCKGITEYYFSRKTLRYQASVTVAFTILERHSRYAKDSPYIEIGRCSPI